MRTLFIILFLLSYSTTYCQDNCPAIIDWKYLDTVDLYDKPGGKVIHQMKNDSANEDFLHLSILKQTDSHFYVSITMTVKKDSSTAWIKKAHYIGAYKRHEQFPMELTLYKNKKATDTDKIIITNWIPNLLTIEKFADKWVFVSLKQNGQTYIGWIQADELCANSYTYCN